MKKRKIPLRTCVVTGEKLDKRDLLRIVRDKDLNVSIDLTGKMNGRGAYIKKDIKVLQYNYIFVTLCHKSIRQECDRLWRRNSNYKLL